MKKILASILIVIISVAFLGCNTEKNLGEIYSVVLSSYMTLDKGLNHDIEFIAIETKTLLEASQKDKEKVLNSLKEYGVPVMDASMDDLKEKGLFDEETLSLKGLLLKVEQVDTTISGKVIIEGSKFRSGTGAIGVKTVLQQKEGKWQIKENKITWIS